MEKAEQLWFSRSFCATGSSFWGGMSTWEDHWEDHCRMHSARGSQSPVWIIQVRSPIAGAQPDRLRPSKTLTRIRQPSCGYRRGYYGPGVGAAVGFRHPWWRGAEYSMNFFG